MAHIETLLLTNDLRFKIFPPTSGDCSLLARQTSAISVIDDSHPCPSSQRGPFTIVCLVHESLRFSKALPQRPCFRTSDTGVRAGSGCCRQHLLKAPSFVFGNRAGSLSVSSINFSSRAWDWGKSSGLRPSHFSKYGSASGTGYAARESQLRGDWLRIRGVFGKQGFVEAQGFVILQLGEQSDGQTQACAVALGIEHDCLAVLSFGFIPVMLLTETSPSNTCMRGEFASISPARPRA